MFFPEFRAKIKENSSKIWLVLAFFTVGVLAFEAGVLSRALETSQPVIVSVPNSAGTTALRESEKESDREVIKEVKETTGTSFDEKNCAFVGSKNSNKYHVPTSRCAKQIKPENKVCFTSVQAAKEKKYLPGCLN